MAEFYRKHALLIRFITSFASGNIGCVVVVSLTVWSLLDKLDSATFTFITLTSLFVMTIVNAKLSYLLDKYSRKQAVRLLNAGLSVATLLAVFIDQVWVYILLFLYCTLYFMVYYTSRNASAQNIESLSRRRLNATLEVTDQLLSMLASGLVVLFFVPLGMTWMMCGAVALCLLSFIQLRKLDDSVDHLPKNNIQQSLAPVKQKDFAWYFSKPIAWLVTLTVFPNLIVLLSNTVNPIYFYDVFRESPDKLAQVYIPFSLGAMLAGLLSSFYRRTEIVIYVCFGLSLLMSLILASYPTMTTFMFANAVFGFTNSTSRVMFRTLVMEQIDNAEVAMFYGLRGSIASGLQFLILLGMSVGIFYFDPNVSVWVLPVVFLFVPILWFFSRRHTRVC